jgi:hypothetical protein
VDVESRGGDAGDGTELDEFDLLLIEFKASGLSDDETALRLACSSKTIARHRKRPAVSAALAARKADRVAQVTALLAEAAVDAVRVLRRGLDAGKEADQVRAASVILNALLRLRVGPETDEQLSALREEVAVLRQAIDKEKKQ